MTDNVREFKLVPKATTVDPQKVAVLEFFLEEAKAGRLGDMVIVSASSDNTAMQYVSQTVGMSLLGLLDVLRADVVDVIRKVGRGG